MLSRDAVLASHKVTQGCHTLSVIASPSGRGNPHIFALSLRGSVATAAIQSEALCGMPGRCGGCRMVPLDCRVGVLPLLTMTKGGRERAGWFVSRFRDASPKAVIASRIVAWQSSLRRCAGCPGDAEVAGWFRWIAASGLCPFSQ